MHMWNTSACFFHFIHVIHILDYYWIVAVLMPHQWQWESSVQASSSGETVLEDPYTEMMAAVAGTPWGKLGHPVISVVS